jgi:hypothetical protein
MIIGLIQDRAQGSEAINLLTLYTLHFYTPTYRRVSSPINSITGDIVPG